MRLKMQAEIESFRTQVCNGFCATLIGFFKVLSTALVK